MQPTNREADPAFVRNPRVIDARIGDNEVALLDGASENYFGLNEVATYIWSRLDAPQSVSGLCKAVLAAYEVEPAECEREVRACLAEMTARELIVVCPDAPVGGS